MKLPLSPGEYMFFTGLIYFLIGMYAVFVDRFAPLEYIQAAWIIILMLPVVVPLPKIMRGSPFWRN